MNSKILNSILFLGISLTSMAQVDFKLIPIVEAASNAALSNKLVFAYFTAEGCAPCVVLEKTVFSDDSFGTYINEKFVAVKSNGVSVNSKFEKMRHKIHAFPTIVYFDATGAELFRIEGKKTKEELMLVSNLILNGEIEKAIEMYPIPVHEDDIFSKDSVPNGGKIK
ncbi:MAG: thioredoxin family protein [Bacteroidota bacterium]